MHEKTFEHLLNKPDEAEARADDALFSPTSLINTCRTRLNNMRNK